jgi:hypothetical protein
VRDFVARRSARLRLVMLPGYCPEINPDELLNQDVKTNALGSTRDWSHIGVVTLNPERDSVVTAHLRSIHTQPLAA